MYIFLHIVKLLLISLILHFYFLSVRSYAYNPSFVVYNIVFPTQFKVLIQYYVSNYSINGYSNVKS